MAQSLRELLKPGLSYWLAYDESLNPHKFRVIKYETVSDTFYTTEYGYVSRRKENGRNVVHISPKGRERISIILDGDERVTDQEVLSLLIYWAVKPLFLAVPVPQEFEEQINQEPLF